MRSFKRRSEPKIPSSRQAEEEAKVRMYKRRVGDHYVGTLLKDKSKDHRSCDRRIADILARQFTLYRDKCISSFGSGKPFANIRADIYGIASTSCTVYRVC